MKGKPNKRTYLGVILIVTGLIFNKWLVDITVAQNDDLASDSLVAIIVIFQLTAILLGIHLVLAKRYFQRSFLIQSQTFLSLTASAIFTFYLIFSVEFISQKVGINYVNDELLERAPIYYRSPTEPFGDVYFRRPGPQVWQGKVIGEMLETLGVSESPYLDESEITVEYDDQGFRNPLDLKDWDIVVVGDSFVELGYLVYEELFTTQLGELLGVKVKNLGASYNSLLTYNAYLEHFGKSENSKTAIMVYFEGNDHAEILNEYEKLQTFRETGVKEIRELRQTSFVKAIYHNFSDLLRRGGSNPQAPPIANAIFEADNGEIQLTVAYTPPNESQLTQTQKSVIDGALRAWSDTAENLDMVPYLVFMPSKRRVLDGKIRFKDNAREEIVDWRPSDLPEFIRRLSHEHGIKFIDPTPNLTQNIADGRLVYNHLWDTHLNSLGSSVVAQVLADELR